MPNKPELVVFVISDEDNSYERIKSNAELEYGLVTQCMKFDKLVSQMDFRVPAEKVADDRRLNSYLDNVVKKINAKIGGTNTAIDFKNLNLNGLVKFKSNFHICKSSKMTLFFKECLLVIQKQ